MPRPHITLHAPAISGSVLVLRLFRYTEETERGLPIWWVVSLTSGCDSSFFSILGVSGGVNDTTEDDT